MQKELYYLIKNFQTSGTDFVIGKRNQLKIFQFQGETINIKSFKKPHLFNAFIYRFFRASKAKRSYEYANMLISKEIKTPEPIAYFENKSLFLLRDSFYVCKHLDYDFMIRDLIETENFPDFETILRQFTQFSFNLHENGIEFLDHSPGNTLIKRNDNNQYDFYLIDLNRMKFHQSMDFSLRMKNLRKITPHQEMIQIISSEYARLYHKNEDEVFKKMWKYTLNFQQKSTRKKKLKKFKW